MQDALKMYYEDNNEYPPNVEDYLLRTYMYEKGNIDPVTQKVFYYEVAADKQSYKVCVVNKDDSKNPCFDLTYTAKKIMYPEGD